ADRQMIGWAKAAGTGRHEAPPRIQRFLVAMQFDGHAAGEFDPVCKMVARHCDHDRNIGAERARDQMNKALALALLPAKTVDDQDVRTFVEDSCDPFTRARQLSEVEPAPRRIG